MIAIRLLKLELKYSRKLQLYENYIDSWLNKLKLELNFSLHFNGHFPGEPGLAGVYWSKGWWRWWWQLDYWSYKSCKAPVKSSPPTNQHEFFFTNQHPVFYRLDALHVAQPTVSKHWRENITFHGQAHLGFFQLCLWPLIALGYLGGGLPCLSSALWCQFPIKLGTK